MLQGDFFTPETTDYNGKPLENKDGTPAVNYYVVLAVPKLSPEWPAFRDMVLQTAREAFPRLQFSVAANGALQCNLPTFAFKITDGDSTVPDMKGKAPCAKEGHPGNWIVKLNTRMAPKVVDYNMETRVTTILENYTQAKRGWWYRMSGNIRGNREEGKQGLFLNMGIVQRMSFDTEISGGISAEEAFASAPLVQYGTQIQTYSTNSVAPGMAYVAPATPATTTTTTTTTPPVTPPPVASFLAGAAAPLPPPPPAGKATVPGCAYTYQQLVDAGYSDEQMKQSGFLV